MIDIIYLIKDFIRERNIRRFINNRLRDKRTFTTMGTADGNLFYIDIDAPMIHTAYIDYDISSINKNTIVLDIGANVGGFALRASRKAKHVYAVEPVMCKQLKRNIKLNKINNITVFECGLGIKKDIQKIVWHNYQKEIEICTMHDILKMCNNNIDYLKLDCEGAEYSICKEDLYGIQQIAAELHNVNGKTPFHIFTDLLKECGFIINIKTLQKKAALIHASRIK